jgi:predicted Zn-dependent protease with MMP-like domain
MPDPDEPETDVLDRVYDALDCGEPAAALDLVRAALADGADDPVLHFLLGVAWLELDEPRAAVSALERAVALDPDDAEFRARLAEALYRCCRFDDAAPHVERAVRADPKLALAHHVGALLAERRGDFDDAERSFARASRLDPDAHPAPVRLDRRTFEAHLETAIEALPSPFREALDTVAVTVEPVPDEAILHDTEPPLDPELLGLFVGLALPERRVSGPGGELPARIYLFQRSLERYAEDEADLVEQIGVTLRHELGHYLGLDEDEIEAAGHA